MSEDIVAVGPVLPSKLGEAVRIALSDDNYSVLVAQLELLIGKVATGLVVYGTMAKTPRSAHPGQSDVDLLLLVQESASGGVFGIADGIEIDLHVHSRAAALSDSIANWAPYGEGRVVFDLWPPELNVWLNKVFLWRREKPDPWTEVDRVRDRASAQRMVNRVIRDSQIDPTAAAMHEARFLAIIPTLYAQVRHRRITSTSKWWSALTREEPLLANALISYASNRSFPPNGVDLQRLLDQLYCSD